MTAFNIDKNVTMKQFNGATQIHVTSMFLTVQGEGPYAGHPAVLVRLAGCNFGAKDLMCQFCDTNFKLEEAECFTPLELAAQLRLVARNHDSLLLVITGGEPTLQPLILKTLRELASPLKPQIFSVFQFESNGTNPEFARMLQAEGLSGLDLSMISFGVSPKVNYRTMECKPPPVDVQTLVEGAGFYKFVISADRDSPHHTLPAWALAKADGLIPVYVSPMAVYKRAPVGEIASAWDAGLVDHEKTAANYSYAAQYVLDNPGLLLSLQTHLFCAVP